MMETIKEPIKQTVEKSDAIDILNRTIDFVRNCDNKASIFLGIFGVVLTIFLTTEGLDDLISILDAATTQRTFCNVFYLLLMIGSIITTTFGLCQIIKVLGVQVDFSKEEGLISDSKVFFECISRNNYLEYKNKLFTMSDEDFFNDVVSQIYINSRICSDKYRNYKCGFKWSLIGFSGFVVLWVIGMIIF